MIGMTAALEMRMARRERVLDRGLSQPELSQLHVRSAGLPIVFILHLMPAPGETLARDRKKLSSDYSPLVVLEGHGSLSDRSCPYMDPSSFEKRTDVLAVTYDCSRMRRTARHRDVHRHESLFFTERYEIRLS
jgi:hypothetical protein